MNYRKKMLAVLVSGLLLTACGGGGTDISGGSSGSSTGGTTSGSTGTGSTVTAGPAASIVADVLTSNFIALKGYNSVKSETAPVTFTVYDAAGIAVPNQTVNFAFSAAMPSDSGYSLNKTQAVTGSDGKVTVTVSSGNIPRSVSVTASLATNTNIKGNSASIASGTALADSKGISLSVDSTNLNADYDGEYGTVIMRLADRFNNPIPDNTSIYFTATMGLVAGDATSDAGATGFCLTKNSTCTAKLTTQGTTVGGTRYGRVTLLAYTDGEESFSDKNANGMLDLDEAFDTAGLPLFGDVDEPHIGNVVYDDLDGNGSVTPADNIYEGFSCSQELINNNQCIKKTVSVWKSAAYTFTSLNPTRAHIQLEYWDATNSVWVDAAHGSVISVKDAEGAYFRVAAYAYSDSNELLPIPSGTKITVTKDNGGTIIDNYPAAYTGLSSQESVFYQQHISEIDPTKAYTISSVYPSTANYPFYSYFQVPKENPVTASTGTMTISAKFTSTVTSTNTSTLQTYPITLTDI
ncbi:Ig-like domain-containing protein [uncultured Tolumonas sp.]|uniref:Ig-like domain-containing protein n=1 Tax=uncultured Tolumonas sp. TaxID=263765 RepID=UPI002A0A8384|nr:Ig-like domain-containing protein [uncultured Tolumonas sp.]